VKYHALLFDLDGTLINTLDLWGEAILAAFKDIGIAVSWEQYRNWYMDAKHLKDWLREYGFTEETQPDFRADRDRRYIELARERVDWCEGAEDMLKFLNDHGPLGLITGSWKSYVDASEKKLHFLKYFRTLVTCEDMGKFQKPHPHGILLAADRMNVKPESCLYVGDQLFDVEAAQAAGMPCCIIHGRFTPDEALKKADIVVKSLRELKAVAEL
jgi:HAD superfamily hydrolase (TIGR01509 family)